MMHRRASLIVKIVLMGLLPVVILANGCSGGFAIDRSKSNSSKYAGGSGKINLAWSPNRDSAVNTKGGGYRIYYSQETTIDAGTPYVEMPFVQGSYAPTSAQISGLIKGKYYVNVQAYSARNPAGSAVSDTATAVIQ